MLLSIVMTLGPYTVRDKIREMYTIMEIKMVHLNPRFRLKRENSRY